MKTCTYAEITEATERVITDALRRAGNLTDSQASWNRGTAVGAYFLWLETAGTGPLNDILEDKARFKKLLGLPERDY